MLSARLFIYPILHLDYFILESVTLAATVGHALRSVAVEVLSVTAIREVGRRRRGGR